MSTDKLKFKDINFGGLGSILGTISSMISMNRQVVWQLDGSTDSDISLGNYITTCFAIPKEKFKFVYDKSTSPDARRDLTDTNKFFSSYFPVDHIVYQEKVFNVNTNYDVKKPCVGVALYDKQKFPGGDIITGDNNGWPGMKMWPMKTYLNLLGTIIHAGYDIIMFDSASVRLDDKIHMLNNNCDFVIGYEGGLHHLAHILKIPSIILPWRIPRDDGDFHKQWIHSLHLDTKTWIFDSIKEVNRLTPDELIRIRNELVEDRGNNLFLSSDIGFNRDFTRVQIDDRQYDWSLFNHHTRPFIAHIQDKKIGGIKEFYYF